MKINVYFWGIFFYLHSWGSNIYHWLVNGGSMVGLPEQLP